jgi:carbon storage regulator CsrA
MLVLVRYRDEEIYLETSDGRITVRVLTVLPGKVRLGFDAPECVRIDRREVAERRRDEQRNEWYD